MSNSHITTPVWKSATRKILQPRLQYRSKTQSIGEHMEETVAHFFKKSDPNAQWIHNSYADIAEGTDIITDDMRIDVTADFLDKDYITLPMDTNIIAYDYTTYKIGVRVGNSYAGGQIFENPVMVLGINCDSQHYSKNIQDQISESLDQHIDTLMLMLADLQEYHATNNPEYDPRKQEYYENNGRTVYHAISIDYLSKTTERMAKLAAELPDAHAMAIESPPNNFEPGDPTL